jgi:regulator of protease activity HflC (stomatin/prohibitin superfamily)
MEVLGGLFALTIITLMTGIRIVKEYDRLVVMRFGKVVGLRGPGFKLVVPFIERAQKVDVRVVTMPIPAQDAITKDNVMIKVTAVCFFNVEDPTKAVLNVQDPIEATGQLAQTAMRTVIGQYELDQLLTARDKLNARLKAAVDDDTERWGVRILSIELKDISVPVQMRRAMAREAEAERLRRATVTNAEGELQAAASLAQAAEIIFAEPGAFQLRRLQSLMEVSAGKNTTMLIPTPFAITGLEQIEDGEVVEEQ